MAVVRSYMTLSYHQINCDSYTKVSDVDLTTNETNCGSCTKVPDVNLTTHTQSCVDKDYQRSFLGADICGRCHTKVGLCLKVRSHHSLVTPKSRAVPFGWTDREKVALFICVPALICVKLRAQELCESRGGRPGLPGPNSPYGLCVCVQQQQQQQQRLCGHTATLNLNSNCVKSLITFLQRLSFRWNWGQLSTENDELYVWPTVAKSTSRCLVLC